MQHDNGNGSDGEKIALEKYGIQVEIIVEEANLPMHVGMNPGKFKETFGWKPAYDLEKMICSPILTI